MNHLCTDHELCPTCLLCEGCCLGHDKDEESGLVTTTEDQAATVPPLAAFLRPQLPPAALYGLPGEVAITLSEASGADPAAVLVTFLALLGNAAGPQPHARFGGADHPARLFAVLVGDAATGRKGTALAAVEPLFAEADPDWAAGRVLYGLQSGEAMIDWVADDHSRDCRLMVVETEFGRLVETMARAGTLSAHLRNAWDGRALQRTTTRFTQRASRAHVSMLAMITPEELLRHHKRLSQAGGLESRILYVYTAPLKDVSPFAEAADHGHLAGRVREVLEASREAVMAHTDPISRYLLTLRGIQPPAALPVDAGVVDAWGRVGESPAAGGGGGVPVDAFPRRVPGDPSRRRLRPRGHGAGDRPGAHGGGARGPVVLRAVRGGRVRRPGRPAAAAGGPEAHREDRPPPARALPGVDAPRRDRLRCPARQHPRCQH